VRLLWLQAEITRHCFIWKWAVAQKVSSCLAAGLNNHQHTLRVLPYLEYKAVTEKAFDKPGNKAAGGDACVCLKLL